MDAFDAMFYKKKVATLPLSTTAIMHLFSTFKRLKTLQQNKTKNERLMDLAHLSLHCKLFVITDKVFDTMASKNR